MGCRTPAAHSIGSHLSHSVAIRPIVLLALHDDDVRARFAYQLAALGFDVVMDMTSARRDACRPDVIVAELAAAPSGFATGIGSEDGRLRAIPVVAVAEDVSDVTRAIARRRGCAAVCLATCSAAALAAGIHAVLGG